MCFVCACPWNPMHSWEWTLCAMICVIRVISRESIIFVRYWKSHAFYCHHFHLRFNISGNNIHYFQKCFWKFRNQQIQQAAIKWAQRFIICSMHFRWVFVRQLLSLANIFSEGANCMQFFEEAPHNPSHTHTLAFTLLEINDTPNVLREGRTNQRICFVPSIWFLLFVPFLPFFFSHRFRLSSAWMPCVQHVCLLHRLAVSERWPGMGARIMFVNVWL